MLVVLLRIYLEPATGEGRSARVGRTPRRMAGNAAPAKKVPQSAEGVTTREADEPAAAGDQQRMVA